MKIGIMGAMPEEIDILKNHMSDATAEISGGREYHCGKIGKHDIVLVFSRWGKVASATTATTLILKYNIDALIFTGVAGAVDPELNIGDVVVSSELYQHDMDATPIFEKHVIPLTDITFFTADAQLSNTALKAVETYLNNQQSMPSEALKKFNIDTPKFKQGVIASGDCFVADQAQTEQLKRERPGTLAVEMEGAAVAQVCSDYAIPFVVIRVISDRADHAAPVDFDAFVKEVASHYTKNIVLSMANY